MLLGCVEGVCCLRDTPAGYNGVIGSNSFARHAARTIVWESNAVIIERDRTGRDGGEEGRYMRGKVRGKVSGRRGTEIL